MGSGVASSSRLQILQPLSGPNPGMSGTSIDDSLLSCDQAPRISEL